MTPAPSNHDFWESAKAVTTVLCDLLTLGAAMVLVIKFRVLHMFSHRYRSEVDFRSQTLPDGRFVLLGDYTVTNTGERPLRLTGMALRLHPARERGSVLEPDENVLLAERIYDAQQMDVKSLFRIEAGERSIFTLRCVFPEAHDLLFLLCKLSCDGRKETAPFRAIYIRPEERREGPNQNVGISGK